MTEPKQTRKGWGCAWWRGVLSAAVTLYAGAAYAQANLGDGEATLDYQHTQPRQELPPDGEEKSTKIRRFDRGSTAENSSVPVRGPRAKALTVTYVDVRDTVVLQGAKRLGLNVGARDTYGANQFIKNLIPNPGFENAEYGTLLHVGDGSDSNTIYQAFWDTSWNNDQYGIGQPVGFWNGGTYEFLYGPAKGRRGTIVDFYHSADRRYVFELDSDGVRPGGYDVMSARKELPGISGWPAMRTDVVDTTTTRPGSTGQQSLLILPTNESWKASQSLFMDSFWRDSDPTAGKMYIVEGPYRLAFWAKGSSSGAQLRVEFRREGEGVFFNETVNLTTDWRYYEFNRIIPAGQDQRRSYSPTEYHPLLVLKIYINAGQMAWLDDMELYKSDETNPTAFTDVFVNKLKELRPGVLRDWGNQLGSSLDNQLCDPFARKTLGWRPHERNAGAYSYSLHEFLELCREVDAEPWYVIPPTLTAEEMINLCEYLCAPADGSHPYADWRAELGQLEPWTSVFPMIHLEWGNEMWGAASGSDPFFGASAMGGDRLGVMAHDRFGAFKDYGPYFDPAKFDFIIGGQVGWPGRQREIEQYSSNHNSVALAPYFGTLSNAWGNTQDIFGPLFAKPIYESTLGNVKQSKDQLASVGRPTRLNIYEINFHTTGDATPLDIRNDFVTSMAGGVAMPLFMLHYMKTFGMREHCAFQALQYSFNRGNGEHVRIWGCLRDLNVTGRKRPTWLGMEIANKAIRGDMIETVHSGIKSSWTQSAINAIYSPVTVDHIQSFAFREGRAYGVVLFNLHLTESKRVRIAAPSKPGSSAKEYILAANSPHADNEDANNVAITSRTVSNFRQYHYTTLPPCSVYVLTWNAAA